MLLAVSLSLKEFMNDYGLYTPYVILIVYFILVSRLTSKHSLFKNPSQFLYPSWLRNGIYKKNIRNGFINLLVGLIFFVLSIYFDEPIIGYFSFAIFGLSFAMLSFGAIHYFFPSSKILPQFDKGKLDLGNLIIPVFVLIYVYVNEAQEVLPTYADDPHPDKIYGKARVIFYLTGMGFWGIMAPLILLTIGRYRIMAMNVILLLSFSIYQVYWFFVDLLSDKYKIILGENPKEAYLFSFIITFGISLFFLENLAFFVKPKDEISD